MQCTVQSQGQSKKPLAEQLRLAQSGDKAAFAALCHYFDPLVVHYTRASHLQALGEEALSVARLTVAEAIQCFDKDKNIPFAAYVASRVKYALWNLFKKERHLWQSVFSYDAWDDQDESTGRIRGEVSDTALFADPHNLEDTVIQRLRFDLVQRALKSLSERQQLVLKAWALGWSLTEIASSLSLTPQAVSQLKKRSLRRLKVSLNGMVESEGR
ncbi:MAG: sigma-70 family RNA polymerase sigma factor [Sporomusaceae bacterium]|nr:sigma-70 family RNA polymerase sigma factor [Sporomusaceae bacterium]